MECRRSLAGKLADIAILEVRVVAVIETGSSVRSPCLLAKPQQEPTLAHNLEIC